MKLLIDKVGKQYNHRWVFRKVSFTVGQGSIFGITGSNGSGKSTLLQIIADFIVPDEGKVSRSFVDRPDHLEFTPAHISIASPYLELFEEFTVEESIVLQGKFKPWRMGITEAAILETSHLAPHAAKQVYNLSSGMKQRLKLALAILADTPLLLLDEPCSNLDEHYGQWYNTLLRQHADGRTVVICSNSEPREIGQCQSMFDLNPSVDKH